jgi:hypothetical protein
MNRHPFRIVIVTALLTFAVTVIALRWDLVPEYRRRGSSGSEAAQPAAPKGQLPLSPEEDTNIRVYNKVSPGVVNITSTVVEYGFFFSPVAKQGTGSGLVLDLEGNILTSYHVINQRKTSKWRCPTKRSTVPRSWDMTCRTTLRSSGWWKFQKSDCIQSPLETPTH